MWEFPTLKLQLLLTWERQNYEMSTDSTHSNDTTYSTVLMKSVFLIWLTNINCKDIKAIITGLFYSNVGSDFRFRWTCFLMSYTCGNSSNKMNEKHNFPRKKKKSLYLVQDNVSRRSVGFVRLYQLRMKDVVVETSFCICVALRKWFMCEKLCFHSFSDVSW